MEKKHINPIPTADGQNPAPVDVVDIPVFMGFIHRRWCRIFSINSMFTVVVFFLAKDSHI